jgi:NPCBM/NEW2 domain
VSSMPPPTKTKKSFWGEPVAVATIIAAVIVAIAGIVAALIGGNVISVSPGGAIQPPPTSTPVPTFASSPTPAPEVSTTSAPSEAPTQAVAQTVTYLDDYASQCGIPLGIGSYSINGTDYAHTVLQWPSDTNDVTIKRQGLRFKATVGIRDDASSEVRVQFELLGDNGKQLFKRVLSYGESQKVDVPVDGILRLTLRVKPVSRKYGYAGWGDARVTSATTLEC